MENKRTMGSCYEEVAAKYLKQHKVRILFMNFRCRLGEVDIIGQDDDALVFFEVKYRKNVKTGYPAEAVDIRKQKKICKISDYYRYIKKVPDNINIRYDVISIIGDEITWYKNAFYYQGSF